MSISSSTCFALKDPLPRWLDAPIANCVASWSTVGLAQGTALYQGRYSRPSPEGPDARVVTEVLFRAAEQQSQVVPLHAVEEDETYNLLQPFTLHSVATRSILELTTCLNGTGGCGQDFFEFKDGTLRPVVSEIREQVEALLPSGLSQNKSPAVNLDQLRGKGGAWSKDDPNCCPSYDVVFDVLLVGDRLRVKNVIVTRAPEQ